MAANDSLSADAVQTAMEEGRNRRASAESSKVLSIPFVQKVLAEAIGTFFLVFTGSAAIMINVKSDGAVTHLGISLAWGVAAMIVIYAVGHISGAHLNPAVTIAFAALRRFPLTNVPIYLLAQFCAATAASFLLRLMFGDVAHVGATIPAESDLQCFVFEILTTFLLMFVISAVATDTRAIGELAGFAIGSTIALDVLISGTVTGASMNPARSLGPAIASNMYKKIWIYMVAPTVGALMGGFSYNMVRLTEKPVREITRSGSYIRQKSIFRSQSSSIRGY